MVVPSNEMDGTEYEGDSARWIPHNPPMVGLDFHGVIARNTELVFDLPGRVDDVKEGCAEEAEGPVEKIVEEGKCELFVDSCAPTFVNKFLNSSKDGSGKRFLRSPNKA